MAGGRAAPGARRPSAIPPLGGSGTGGQPVRLGLQGAYALVGEPVVAPEAALLDLLAVQDDQPAGGEPVQHAVQRADPQLHRPVGQLLDLAQDPVAVPRLIGQGRQYEERRLRHAPRCHAATIYIGFRYT
ncbi:hypothetical protein SGLAM104S_02598 [Streptomyces glaucescens]